MKVLIAANEFKGSLSAVQVNNIIAEQAKKYKYKTIEVPISDGGDGFLDVLLQAFPKAKVHKVKVRNVFMQQIETRIIMHKNIASIETACVCGKRQAGKLNVMKAGSYGVGQVIKKALDLKAKEIYIGLGGVICNDAGVGMAKALGVKFLTKTKRELKDGLNDLKNLRKIDISGLDKRLSKVQIHAVTDVKNPLLGKTGSAFVFARQKGANEKQIKIIGEGLLRLARIIKKDLKKDIGYVPGAGAAGGIAAGLLAFTDAEIVPGPKYIFSILGLEEKIEQADVIITGEGKLDRQTFFGKAPYRVAKVSARHGKPIIFICGQMALHNTRVLISNNIKQVFSLERLSRDEKDSKKNAAKYLAITANAVMDYIKKIDL